MTKRVVSKQTKLLFIAFGALSIATMCIVSAAESNDEDIRVSTPHAIVHSTAPTPTAK